MILPGRGRDRTKHETCACHPPLRGSPALEAQKYRRGADYEDGQRAAATEALPGPDFAEWAGGRTAVKSIVSDLGDAAYNGPAGDDEPIMLGFRKGTRAVRLTTLKIGADGKRVVTMQQLRALAELVASRLD